MVGLSPLCCHLKYRDEAHLIFLVMGEVGIAHGHLDFGMTKDSL